MLPRFIGSGVCRPCGHGGGHPLRIPRVSTVIDLAPAPGGFAPLVVLMQERGRMAGRKAGAIHAPGRGTRHGMKDRASGFCCLDGPMRAEADTSLKRLAAR